MTVYVGKDVTVKIQRAVEEDITHKLAVVLSYLGVKQADSGSHEAYHHSADSEPTPPFGTELADDEYDQIARSDDIRYSKSTTTNLEYAIMLFRYKCAFAESEVKKIVVKFEGYGTAPAGNGVTMKIWDHVSSAWSNEVSGTAETDETLMITLTTDLGNYVDDDGYIWVLVRTTNPSDGTTAAELHCDYASCFVSRAKFTVDHTPISDRDMDGVADEPEHVTVKVNGSEVTVSSVDDSEGSVILASGDFNEGDVITCSYRYDSEPFIAQEFSLEPKQRIEGIDGLGSDTIQLWAPLLREIDGSIKEVLKVGDLSQLERTKPLAPEIYDSFNNLTLWTKHTSKGVAIENFDGDNRLKLYEEESEHGHVILNHKIKNFDLTLQLYGLENPYSSSRTYIHFKCYTLEIYHYDGWIRLKRRPSGFWTSYGTWNGEQYIIAQSANGIIGKNVWKTLRLRVHGSHIQVWVDGSQIFDLYDYADTSEGDLRLAIYGRTTYFDDFKIKAIEADENGIIATWNQAGSAVKIGLDGVIFPEGSIPAPKNEPVYIVTPFKARSIRVIT